ncbi:uncharacterized protein N7515_006718 [Penicillium bovifimosum]|uniref:Uncharacterized protein n=1 Tax=Penicillium bovifimosum TaxID=126998 RepID=A0A9W9GV75_9EURO|nr:uncharacterized protein N7515_006718 [Penicillium bovifimosum]KAJ5130679.1 hypothetical protein N7515_006718 [Penicillium bovifimosum]
MSIPTVSCNVRGTLFRALWLYKSPSAGFYPWIRLLGDAVVYTQSLSTATCYRRPREGSYNITTPPENKGSAYPATSTAASGCVSFGSSPKDNDILVLATDAKGKTPTLL